jgi:hypothetical protein
MLFREFCLPTMAARCGEMMASAEAQNWGYRKLQVGCKIGPDPTPHLWYRLRFTDAPSRRGQFPFIRLEPLFTRTLG